MLLNSLAVALKEVPETSFCICVLLCICLLFDIGKAVQGQTLLDQTAGAYPGFRSMKSTRGIVYSP